MNEINSILPSYEEELSLLGAWLIGNHREDINYLDKDLFIDMEDFYEGVKKGLTYFQIKDQGKTNGITYSQLLEYGTGNPGGYYGARATALSAQKSILAKRIAEGAGDPGKNLQRLNEIQAVINEEEYKPNTTGYADLFIEDWKNKQDEKQPKYGQGFKFLDTYTGGIHRGQLTVIGARPRIGKSAIASQIGLNVADQGYKVLYLPLEMTAIEILERLLLQSQTIDREDLTDPKPNTERDIRNFLEYLERDGTFKICEALNQLTGIEKRIKEEKPYLVIIDQLTQVKPAGKHKDNREKYIEVTRELKRIALEQKVAIILLSQLNRASTDQHQPSIESLHESDSTGQDADNVFTLYTRHDEEETDAEERETYLYIAKQRNGISGKEIPLMFRGERLLFSPVELRAVNYVR